MRAKVSSDIPEGVLWVARSARGLDGKRVNVLVSDGAEELGGGAVLNSTRVKIKKVVKH